MGFNRVNKVDISELVLSVLVTLGSLSCPGPNSAIWIGLIDENHNRNFQWTDGTTLNYKNWTPGIYQQ